MIADCWNAIGVRGDRSCVELERYAHCRNCHVYAAAATALMRETPPADDLDERTRHVAEPLEASERRLDSAFLFRIGSEWLALATACVTEVAEPKPVHSLPHRRGGAILGVTSVRGELVTAVELASILGLDASSNRQSGARTRLLVLRREDLRVVCPADEIHGVHRYHGGDLRDVPGTLARSATRYSTRLLAWRGRTVGLLDAELLFYSLKRSLA